MCNPLPHSPAPDRFLKIRNHTLWDSMLEVAYSFGFLWANGKSLLDLRCIVPLLGWNRSVWKPVLFFRPAKLQVRSTFQGLTCGGHEIFAQHVCVLPLPLAAVGHERAIYFPRPLRTQGIWHPIFDVLPKNVNIPKPPICVASNMCASSRNVNIPKKPICVASNMCASSRNPEATNLRSMKHVCKFKESRSHQFA